jgi:uncharacterized protein
VTDVAGRLARLGGALREHGVGTSLREELDGADALRAVDPADREEVRTALRIALRIPRSAWDVYERLFEAVWSDAAVAPPMPNERRADAASPRPGRALHWNPDARRMGDVGTGSVGGDQPGYSPDAVLRRKAFDDAWSAQELVAMERLLARLARRLATRRSRKLVPTRGRGRADVRRSYRRALRTSGELVSLARRARAVDRPKLVFLVDTSGSMDAYARFLLPFVLSLRRAAPSAEAFACGTELVPLTRSLLPGKLALTLRRLAERVPDWSGGTRLGACFEAFLRDHAARCLDARTVVVVLSDGLDRGDAGQLADSVREIRRRARKLVWLNPLANDARYEPSASGIAAAMPFVDLLAPASDLASLERALPRLSA